jgi:hypothetical protein
MKHEDGHATSSLRIYSFIFMKGTTISLVIKENDFHNSLVVLLLLHFILDAANFSGYPHGCYRKEGKWKIYQRNSLIISDFD